MGTLDAHVNWNTEKEQIDIHATADDGPKAQTLIEGYVSPNAPGEDPGVPGDVNGDDVVNITDVTWMLDILLGNVEVTDGLTPDVNGDGSVTIADLTFIIDQMVASGQL